MTIERRVSVGESPDAQAFLDKLQPQDRANVERVVEIVDLLATDYDGHAFGGERGRRVIFGAYGVGGWVDKDGPRPDVDLLVVTNTQWEDIGYVYTPPEWPREWVYAKGDSFIENVAGHFRATGFEVEIPDEDNIPNEYSEGIEPRMMLRLEPKEDDTASPIDIVYISGGYSRPKIKTFEDFYEQDVTSEGQQMGKVALSETVVTIPAIERRM